MGDGQRRRQRRRPDQPDGKVDEFELEGVAAPTGIAVDPEGRIWVTEGGGVASFLPSDPKGTSKATAIADVKDPASIVAGPDGQMWVAAQGKVVHFLPAKPGESKSVAVAGPGARKTSTSPARCWWSPTRATNGS